MYQLPPNLKVLREKKSEGQEALALYLDVAKNTVSNWENGKNMPNIKQLQQIAEYYKISMDDLVSRDLSKPEVINMVLMQQDTYGHVIKKADLHEITAALKKMKQDIEIITNKIDVAG